MIDAQRSGEDGRSVCLINRPFEVPDRIHTAGSARLDGKRRAGLGCGRLGVGSVVGSDNGESFIAMLLDGMVCVVVRVLLEREIYLDICIHGYLLLRREALPYRSHVSV